MSAFMAVCTFYGMIRLSKTSDYFWDFVAESSVGCFKLYK